MHIKYKKPFLKEVIVRVDFASTISEINKGLPKIIANAILHHFPISEPRKQVAFELQIGPKEEIQRKNFADIEWRYHGRNKDKTMCLSKDFFWIAYKHYPYYEILKKEFTLIMDVLSQHYKELEIRRFGVRYVNMIDLNEPNPTSWENYLDKKLLTIFELSENKSLISRAFHNFVLNYGDMVFKFKYGMHNPDYPAPIRTKKFVLDYDAYYEGLQSKEDVIKNLEKFHEYILDFYEKCITNNLRKKMGDIKRDE